ncbi:hypothetical protein Fot_21977 [Forsythia ovata]|uniref:Uncharacterized protein n=1 Tax=Forsythia ovata TaxID=205694 RepID=A0ABD1UWE2_9LAMI
MEKKIAEKTEEALGQKKKVPVAREDLMKDARKTRQTEEISLKGKVKGFDDQVCLYKNPSHTPDLMGALDAMEEVLAGYEESKAVGSEDADGLRSENKNLCSKIDLTEQAKYKAMKVETMQNVCNDAWRRAEWKLKVYEDMAYAKLSNA